MSYCYAGIGSRITPPSVLVQMRDIAGFLSAHHYVLRSGGADGADKAFENGARGHPEIFLPWRGFNQHSSALFETGLQSEAARIAAYHHPAWAGLAPAVRKLMARNVRQVLGRNLDDPSKFIVCWTPDGCESAASRSRKTGGTGLAIAVAGTYGIPVINLANPGAVDCLTQHLWRCELLRQKGLYVDL